MLQIRFTADSLFRVFAFVRSLETYPSWRRLPVATADSLLRRGLAVEKDDTTEGKRHG